MTKVLGINLAFCHVLLNLLHTFAVSAKMQHKQGKVEFTILKVFSQCVQHDLS